MTDTRTTRAADATSVVRQYICAVEVGDEPVETAVSAGTAAPKNPGEWSSSAADCGQLRWSAAHSGVANP